MRYTEARLSRITTLLLDELDEGTIDFQANYDGSTQEPEQLPARLPFAILNGASGIAVGLATEIPSHNLSEVADACVALIKNPKLSDLELANILPGPDYPGGGQIISSAQEIADAYRTGRGSLKVRARWVIEDLARGQWQMVVNTLPPGVSSQKVLEEIEEITNPKVKAGKKTLTPEQNALKASVLSVLDVVRDESSKDAAVRLVFEPKTRTIEQQELIQVLLAHTSLESSSSINLTAIGIDGKPVQKSLRQMFNEWIEFRQITVQRRSNFRLQKVLDRIHILEGRQLVLLNIDEVIAIIRQSDEPKQALIDRFLLSERQAEDILEIRLRQLARLEAIKIEQELKNLIDERKKLEEILSSPASQRRLMIKEIEADAKIFGDERRTLIQADKRSNVEVKVVDEPVTVIISDKGWVRARSGHGHDRAGFSFKAGDTLYDTFECRTVDTVLCFGSNGRVYSVPVTQLPGARGDGQPLTTLVELESATQLVHYVVGPPTAMYLLSNSAGYGFMATIESMVSRNRSGKSFLSLNAQERVLRPSLVDAASQNNTLAIAKSVACVSMGGRILSFDISEMKIMEKGGRGLMLIDLDKKDELAGAAAYVRSILIKGLGRGGKEREETLEIRSLNNAKASRAKKGKTTELGFKPNDVRRVE